MTLQEIIRRAIGDGSALWVPTPDGPAELHKVTPGEPVPMELQRSLWRTGRSFLVLARPVIVHDAWQPIPLAPEPAMGKLLGLGRTVRAVACYAPPPRHDPSALDPPPEPVPAHAAPAGREGMTFG
jgi:hypothetical protein